MVKQDDTQYTYQFPTIKNFNSWVLFLAIPI